MRSRILLDGATGTRLWTLAEEAGVEKVSTWRYNVENPEFVIRAQKEYIDAGSQIILTNTFNANALEIGKTEKYTVSAVVSAAVQASKKAAEGTDVKVALDVGPLTELLEPYGDLEEERAEEIFAEQIDAGVSAGADIVFIETFMDIEMMKIAARHAKSKGVPVFCSMSFSKGGRTMFGNSVEDVAEELSHIGVDAIGLNCSVGPDLAVPIIKEFAEHTDLPLIFKPNAGMPVTSTDGTAHYDCSAEDFISQAEEAFLYATYIGGCCGTDPSYIKALKKRLSR